MGAFLLCFLSVFFSSTQGRQAGEGQHGREGVDRDAGVGCAGAGLAVFHGEHRADIARGGLDGDGVAAVFQRPQVDRLEVDLDAAALGDVVLSGEGVMGAAYYDGGNVGLTFVSSADFDTFTGVQVDGKTIDKSCYIAEEGSIEVYLKAVYLRTLAAGKHTVTILSSQGNTTAEFRSSPWRS